MKIFVQRLVCLKNMHIMFRKLVKLNGCSIIFFFQKTLLVPLAADVIVKVVVAAAPRQFNSSLCSIAHARAGPEKFI